MSKIYLAEKTQLEGVKTPFATCSTSAATAAKTVTASGFTLKTGATVNVKFTYTNTASNPTLNVNGTGAKYIKFHNAYVPAGMLMAGATYHLVYGGSWWEIMGNHFAETSSSSTALLFSGSSSSINGSESITLQSHYVDFGYKYSQGFRAVLLSYIRVKGPSATCTLTCGGHSSSLDSSNYTERWTTLVTSIPSSGSGYCKLTGSSTKASGYSTTFEYGNAYWLT